MHGFNWGATDIGVSFPGDASLLTGQSSSLTYQTTLTSYSRSVCAVAGNSFSSGCLIAYSAFGDPIGGTPGIKPSAIAQLSYGAFQFSSPTFQDGSLTYILSPAPEPASWMLAICGVGLVGAALRGRRGRSLTEGTTAASG